MIWIIIALLIWGIGFFKYENDILEVFLFLFGYIGIAIIIGGFIGNFIQPTYTLSQTSNLVRLSEKDGIHGSFFLSTGSVNNKSYASFVKQVKNDGLRIGKIELCKHVTIYEKNTNSAKLEYYSSNLSNWQLIYALNFHPGLNVFTVPNGTVQRGYSL